MKLLSIEWMKLKSYKTFWILVSLYMLLSILGNYIGVKALSAMSTATMNLIKQTFSFPSAWDYVGNMQSWFVLFLVFFVIISISNEFTFRTHRQHVIDGLSRLDFLHSKFILIGLVSMVSMLFYIVLTLVIAMINGGGNPIPHSEKIIYVFFYTFNYCSFAALIAFFVRRTGLSIIIFFAYVIFESFVSWMINMKFNTSYGNLMPLQCSDELLPITALDSMGSIAGLTSSPVPQLVLFLACLGFIVLYYIILRKKITTTDL